MNLRRDEKNNKYKVVLHKFLIYVILAISLSNSLDDYATVLLNHLNFTTENIIPREKCLD